MNTRTSSARDGRIFKTYADATPRRTGQQSSERPQGRNPDSRPIGTAAGSPEEVANAIATTQTAPQARSDGRQSISPLEAAYGNDLPHPICGRRPQIRRFAKQHGFSFPYIVDEAQEVGACGAVCVVAIAFATSSGDPAAVSDWSAV
ncbi:MAG: hypothetical protein ACM30D_03630, partial [Hyphomicrobiales bacterium]